MASTERDTIPVLEHGQLVDAVLDAAASLILVVDAEGRLVRWNRACDELLGYGQAELEAPFALLVKADSPIRRISDISGKKLGSPAGGAALKLFPLLAKKNSLDATKVEVVNMAPNLQEQMLIRGDVDISALFTATSYMNLVAIKQDPDKDFRWIYYSDGGLDL